MKCQVDTDRHKVMSPLRELPQLSKLSSPNSTLLTFGSFELQNTVFQRRTGGQGRASPKAVKICPWWMSWLCRALCLHPMSQQAVAELCQGEAGKAANPQIQLTILCLLENPLLTGSLKQLPPSSPLQTHKQTPLTLCGLAVARVTHQ